MQDLAYREIPLHRRDGTVRDVAIVDASDFDALNEYRWCYSSGYAVRRIDDDTKISMHRQVLGLTYGDGLETDHINRDKLDNRRVNLRVVSHAENNRNVGPKRHGSSRYRGVSWQKDRQRWRARIRVDGRAVHLGYFQDEDAAGHAASDFLRELGWVGRM